MMYHRVMKINSKSNGGNEYGQKKIIKTAINVLPIIIVPLVVERKRIKSHPEIYKSNSCNVKCRTSDCRIKQQVQKSIWEIKTKFDNKRELKKIAKENDPEYIQKKGEKLAKKNYKERVTK